MQDNREITNEEVQKASEIINNLLSYYNSKVVGQPYLGYSLLVAMMTNGHVLLESVPGLAKTTAARVMTEAVNGSFSRIQCTPDLIPSDIIGTQMYNMATNTFEDKIGPVYSNFVLLDEINRSSAKTQSAMLEAMQEREVSIGGKTYKLPEVFVVIATQNPIESEGTYVLSEAQLDRFLLKETVTYPSARDEMEILNRVEAGVFSDVKSVASVDDVVYLQKLCKRIYIDPAIKKYIVDIVQATRMTDKILVPELAQYVAMGASTRAAIAFMEVAKAIALINGRRYCVPDDVKIAECEQFGLPISDIEFESPYLLHSKLGAYYAAHKYNVEDDEICSAIQWHTTGKPAMTLLEKIVFIADYIEPYRNKAANLDDIRHMAFTDIDMAAYVILDDTLSYIRKTGRNIDTQTVDTYEYYKGIIKEREN